jgi:ubiquinone/menaquinone biosynthesis C-methylase UbiE
MNFENKFLEGLIELGFQEDVKDKLKKLSSKVKWAKGWPEKKESFWNAEAFMWQHKISSEKRDLITKELLFLNGKKNLDLGCGSYSYIPSVGFDVSEKMLQFNENLVSRVKGDLEKKLPFQNNYFDSVTAIFVLNYICNYDLMLKSIKRILMNDGCFMMVLSAKQINSWQRQKEINRFNAGEWKKQLEKSGFKVDFYEKEELWFFKCSLISV